MADDYADDEGQGYPVEGATVILFHRTPVTTSNKKLTIS